MPFAIKAAGVILAIGLGGKFFGDGLNDAADSVVKLAVVGGVGYVVLKKTKVI